MTDYTIFFTVFGLKKKMTVTAYSRSDAIQEVRDWLGDQMEVNEARQVGAAPKQQPQNDPTVDALMAAMGMKK